MARPTHLLGIKLRPRIGLGSRQLQTLLNRFGACEEGRARFKGLTLAQAWKKASAADLAWFLGHLVSPRDVTGLACHCRSCIDSDVEQQRVADLIRANFRFDGTRKKVRANG